MFVCLSAHVGHIGIHATEQGLIVSTAMCCAKKNLHRINRLARLAQRFTLLVICKSRLVCMSVATNHNQHAQHYNEYVTCLFHRICIPVGVYRRSPTRMSKCPLHKILALHFSSLCTSSIAVLIYWKCPTRPLVHLGFVKRRV